MVFLDKNRSRWLNFYVKKDILNCIKNFKIRACIAKVNFTFIKNKSKTYTTWTQEAIFKHSY